MSYQENADIGKLLGTIIGWFIKLFFVYSSFSFPSIFVFVLFYPSKLAYKAINPSN